MLLPVPKRSPHHSVLHNPPSAIRSAPTTAKPRPTTVHAQAQGVNSRHDHHPQSRSPSPAGWSLVTVSRSPLSRFPFPVSRSDRVITKDAKGGCAKRGILGILEPPGGHKRPLAAAPRHPIDPPPPIHQDAPRIVNDESINERDNRTAQVTHDRDSGHPRRT